MSADEPPRAPASAEATLALAHALRTPLTSLSLGLGLLDEGALGPLDPPQRDLVHVLVGEVSRLALLVDRALRTERLGLYAGPIERVTVDLAMLIRDAAVPIDPQAALRGVALSFALREGIVAVVDPLKLGWVVTSLLGNALRYSPEGASIEVGLDRADGEAQIRIEDRGPGIPEEVVARIFAREGGRGLFLAREIVEAHGGRLALRSAPGQGSTFTIALPAAPDRGHEPGDERTLR